MPLPSTGGLSLRKLSLAAQDKDGEADMMRFKITALLVVLTAVLSPGGSRYALGDEAKLPKGFYAFGPDQTIADIGKVDWQPLKLDGLPAGVEIASLRGELGKGGGEILLRVPANYTVP